MSEPEVQPVMEVGGDDMLRVLAKLAQESGTGFEISLTLWTGAGTIGGILMGRDAWWEGVATHLGDKAGEGGAAIGAAFVEGNLQSDLARDADEEPLYEFIHLREARPSHSPRPTTGEGAWWRGRISRVDGWCFGTLDVR